MNILLWVLQIALAFLGLAGGSYKVTHFELLQPTVAAMRELPRCLWVFLGAVECLAGLGLVLPGLSRKLSRLSVYAAAVLGVESVVISGLYFHYGDLAPLPFSATMAILAGVIVVGRRRVKSAGVSARRRK